LSTDADDQQPCCKWIKGAGVAELWPAILGQSVLAVGFMLTAVARFKKTLA